MYYRDPKVEEGKRNIILQNRCGSRLTLLIHPGHTDIELVYKPNAFRRKDFRARNFSNRDVFTPLFRAFTLPEIGDDAIHTYAYDPFVTRLHTESHTMARNDLTVLNIADENAFAISATRPLLLVVQPHTAFTVTDGLLTEAFSDRGEDIVSFVHFPGMEANRFRMTDAGAAVLQITEGDVVIVGGEENMGQVRRLRRRLDGLPLEGLIDLTERTIQPVLETAQITCTDDDMQRLFDLNRRLVYSGLDEGGACFGALNRIYYLIWLRDGAMAATQFARSGLTAFLKIWTPFVLANPGAAYTQLLGTRWSKTERDGIYYAVISLYTLYDTTADPALLHPQVLESLLAALDANIDLCFDDAAGFFLADTRGETTLKDSPTFGYDAVTGEMFLELSSGEHEGKTVVRAATLYHNVNLYNTLRMVEVLLEAGDRYPERRTYYGELAHTLRESLQRHFVTAEGVYRAGFLELDDGTQVWDSFQQGDQWEYAWAVTMGPFFPDRVTALNSARMVRREWADIKPYGYCPWNALARTLREFGYSTGDYRAMLRQEVEEALMETEKYPMAGAMTEYQGDTEGWRGLPFSIGTFVHSLTALMVQSLPQGLAVRASDCLERIERFHYRTSLIDVVADGQGDSVSGWTLNGREMRHTLQIPEADLRDGRNHITVTRGSGVEDFRLYGSEARLRLIEERGEQVLYHFSSAVPCDLLFEHFERRDLLALHDAQGRPVAHTVTVLPGTALTRVAVAAHGDFVVRV